MNVRALENMCRVSIWLSHPIMTSYVHYAQNYSQVKTAESTEKDDMGGIGDFEKHVDVRRIK